MKSILFFASLPLTVAITPVEAQIKPASNDYANRVKQIFQYSNSQNLKKLRNAFADTMRLYSLSGDVIMNNPDDLIAFFKSNFEKFPKEKSTIENLMVIGNKAIVKEKITGHEKDKPVYDVMIFEFAGNKIASAWIIFEQ